MQKVGLRLGIGRIFLLLFICGLGIYFFARPWTPFWVDMLVGAFAVGIAFWEWAKARKSKKSGT